MFYRVRARVRRGEATVRVLVLPADVTALVALGALYLDTGQFLLYVFVLHDQLKVDLEREFSRVSKCLYITCMFMILIIQARFERV